MKILYINSLYAPYIGGGAEIVLKSLVEGMQGRGHEVAVLTTGAAPGLQKDEIDGVRIWRAGIKNLYWQHSASRLNPMVKLLWHWNDRYNSSMRGYIKEVIRLEKPDLVNCHNLAGWSIAAWDEIRESTLPIVQTLHDYYLLCSRSTMFNDGKVCDVQCVLCEQLRRKHSTKSSVVDCVVGVSSYVLERICDEGYFEKSKKAVIYNACNIPASNKNERNELSPIRFGYIGTLSESKGLEWLIRQYQKNNLQGTLTIAGSGQKKYEDHLKTLVNSDSIKFVGYVPSEEFYSQIDVCIVPSLWAEPFGMVTIEANASHLPVITSGRGGQAEIVTHEENGLIVDPSLPDTLGNALCRIADDRDIYQYMVSRARKSVENYLDINGMLDAYENLYRFYTK